MRATPKQAPEGSATRRTNRRATPGPLASGALGHYPALESSCLKHPQYGGVRFPRVDCKECVAIFYAVRPELGIKA